jgi:hypothetical protein
MARPAVGIKLDVLGKAEVISALREAGVAGEKMADTIEKAGEPASKGLLLVDRAAGSVRERLDDIASSAGPVGEALAQFGSIGKVAAVAIGGITLAFGAMIAKGREASQAFAEIGNQADMLGLTAEALQRVQAAAFAVGVDAEGTADLLLELADRAGDAMSGGGDAAEVFDRLGVSVTDAGGKLRPLQSILNEVADGFAAVESPIERVNLASALFGDVGRKMIPVLSEGAAGLKRLGDEAADTGIIVSNQMVRASQDLNDELEKQWKIIDTQLSVAMVGLAPLFQDLLAAIIPVVTKASELADIWRDISRQGTRTITRNYEDVVGQQVDLDAQIRAQRRKVEMGTTLRGRNAGSRGAATDQMVLDRLLMRQQELAAQSKELRAEIDRRAAMRTPPTTPGTNSTKSADPDDSTKTKTKAPALERVNLGVGGTSPLPVPRGMTAPAYQKQIEDFQKAKKDEADEVERTRKAFEDLRQTGIQDVTQGLVDFASGLRSGEDVLKQFLSDLARDLPELLLNGASGTMTTGAGSLAQSAISGTATKLISGFIGSLFGGAVMPTGGASGIGAARGGSLGDGLRGFASGGSFDVTPATSMGRISPQGGDDQLVAFRAQIGERVTVTPRGASDGGGSMFRVNVNIMGDATDSTVERFRAVAAAEIMRAAPSLTARAVTATDDELRKNPDFGR